MPLTVSERHAVELARAAGREDAAALRRPELICRGTPEGTVAYHDGYALGSCHCAPGVGQVGSDLVAICDECGRVMFAATVGAVIHARGIATAARHTAEDRLAAEDG